MIKKKNWTLSILTYNLHYYTRKHFWFPSYKVEDSNPANECVFPQKPVLFQVTIVNAWFFSL